MKRFFIQRSDDAGTIERDGQPVSHTWDVIDRVTGWSVRNTDTRAQARQEARERNAEVSQ